MPCAVYSVYNCRDFFFFFHRAMKLHILKHKSLYLLD